ncbi:MAG: PEP-CTERM sorting domain-containing protein [Planctomycetota bacterium]
MFTFWTHASTYHASSTFLRFNTDATMVPVPGAVLLGMLGLGVAGVKLRKRA